VAERLGVSAKAVSRWEKGDSTPDIEKLIAISDMFEISLDELVMDKVPTQIGEASSKSEIAIELKEKVLTDENKKKAKKGLKIAAIIFGVIVLIDTTPSQALRRAIVLWALSPMWLNLRKRLTSKSLSQRTSLVEVLLQ
jgi:transcriptional regulator with XRE-family HTH domain